MTLGIQYEHDPICTDYRLAQEHQKFLITELILCSYDSEMHLDADI